MKNDFNKSIKNAAEIIDLWLPLKIQYDRLSGLAVGIVHRGKLVYKKGFGFADTEKKTKIDEFTNYRIASISKIFTTVAILQLAEHGKLNLDDKIEKRLSWFRAARKKNNSSENITIRQILSHTAGVFRDGKTPHWITDKFPTEEELKKSISENTIVFENLTKFKYSNFGFALLGQIVKEASGISYEQYVKENIIRKIGMKNTFPDYEENVGNLAIGYSRIIPGKEREAFKNVKTNSYASATGFISNVDDLAKFISALSLESKGKNILFGRESKKEMMRPYWETGEKDSYYGLGLDVYKIKNRKIIGHDGGFAGFITRISLDVENDIGVITLSNSNGSPAAEINSGIFEIIYSLIDEKEKFSSDKKIADKRKFEGLYRSRWTDEIIFGTESSLLVFNPETNSPLDGVSILKHKGKDKFTIFPESSYDSPGEPAKFVFDKKTGKAIKLIWGSSMLEKI